MSLRAVRVLVEVEERAVPQQRSLTFVTIILLILKTSEIHQKGKLEAFVYLTGATVLEQLGPRDACFPQAIVVKRLPSSLVDVSWLRQRSCWIQAPDRDEFRMIFVLQSARSPPPGSEVHQDLSAAGSASTVVGFCSVDTCDENDDPEDEGGLMSWSSWSCSLQ